MRHMVSFLLDSNREFQSLLNWSKVHIWFKKKNHANEHSFLSSLETDKLNQSELVGSALKPGVSNSSSREPLS